MPVLMMEIERLKKGGDEHNFVNTNTWQNNQLLDENC